MGKIKIRKLMADSLYDQWQAGLGQPKTGKVHNGTEGRIHSNQTFRTYKRQCDYFANWLRDNGHNGCSKEEAIQLVPEYIQTLKSASTKALACAAISKALRVHKQDLQVELPERHRKAIVRSRQHVDYDRHFSAKNNADLVTFCECTGLRRHELEALHGTDCRIVDADTIYIQVVGKGGKPRQVRLYGSKTELSTCRRIIEQAGSGKCFTAVHAACDVHFYRSVYACRVYKAHERDLQSLPMSEKYYCRGDMQGHVFDRQALLEASRMLGHNRIDVVVTNYMYNL